MQLDSELVFVTYYMNDYNIEWQRGLFCHYKLGSKKYFKINNLNKNIILNKKL